MSLVQQTMVHLVSGYAIWLIPLTLKFKDELFCIHIFLMNLVLKKNSYITFLWYGQNIKNLQKKYHWQISPKRFINHIDKIMLKMFKIKKKNNHKLLIYFLLYKLLLDQISFFSWIFSRSFALKPVRQFAAHSRTFQLTIRPLYSPLTHYQILWSKYKKKHKNHCPLKLLFS